MVSEPIQDLPLGFRIATLHAHWAWAWGGCWKSHPEREGCVGNPTFNAICPSCLVLALRGWI